MSCSRGRLLVNIDMLILLLRMMVMVMVMMIVFVIFDTSRPSYMMITMVMI